MALNRYLCRTVLPLMTKNAKLFGDAAESGSLIETVLLTAYRPVSFNVESLYAPIFEWSI